MTLALLDDARYLKQVRNQYENYPYPPRDPEHDKVEFNYPFTCGLDALNYYHYQGKRDFTKGFRALIAGGGTGDSAIALAEQCRDFDADIIHLDISETSINLAKERAKVRGLTNISWVHGSLLDAPKICTISNPPKRVWRHWQVCSKTMA
jgi:SAM-dependent methyltransferase